MKLVPYLMFNGHCAEAFKFYEQCLGGKISDMTTYAATPEDSPMAAQITPDMRDKIMHVQLTVGDQELMGADNPPGHADPIGGFSVSIGVKDPAEAERIFQALAENGTVKMPIQPTFWAARFGMLVDQFGTPWMINCDPVA